MQTVSPAPATNGPDGPAYLIDGQRLAAGDAGLQAALARAYGLAGSARPRCLCTPAGVEMYISRIAGAFHLKRMPGQGAHHAWTCPSFAPPPELSGLGQVLGGAIEEDPASGLSALKLGFSLARVSRRAPALEGEPDASAATGSGARLSLRGLLHLLWEDAGFNSWSPAMSGKRNWAVIRKYVLAAAAQKLCRGVALAHSLYLPEPWDEARREEIARRRREAFLQVAAAPRAKRRLLLLLGEVRLLEPSRYGHRLVVKHAPDVDFLIEDDLHAALRRRFETEISAWEAGPAARDAGTRLIVMGTFSVGLSGRAAMEELVLMTVTPNWIPVEDAFDAEVVARLAAAGARFRRCLRYNLPLSAPIACATATTAAGPIAYFVVRPSAGEGYEERLQRLIAETGVAAWVWRPAEGPPPALHDLRPVSHGEAAPTRFDPFA